MSSSLHTKLFVAAWVSTSLLLFNGLSRFAHAQGGKPSGDTVNMIVLVKEADTGQPISQAHLTLQFTEPGDRARFGKAKKITYNAKTDTQGRYKFVGINKGTIVLTVTATGRQTYGKQLQLENDNQVFEVKLKKPQPLI
ncbi:MAG TPA: carboxypeptidase-like regulatory domain-containing protein [Terriglobia bacterium]|nr:carboxypeptidase-like regulatory domain-containing protein [Terriglobia bacterium]